MTQGLTYAQWQEKVTDLESRVEGLETLLADAVLEGRIVLSLAADSTVAAAVEAEQHQPSPAWERQS